jgi:pumilio RNA-binding family
MVQMPASTMIEAPATALSDMSIAVLQNDPSSIGMSAAALHHGEMGNPLDVAENAERCSELLAKFDQSTPEQSYELAEKLAQWLTPVVRRFALSREGCRVVQKVLEHAGAGSRDKLAKQLERHIPELIGSPHGNHVVAKMVEIMPPGAVGFVIEAVKKNPAEFARHRFGCRILERLVEHCSEKQMSSVYDVIVGEAEPLCRHPYSNFVISHLLEHGSSGRRVGILDQLLPTLPQLAVHRTASHVVQKAIDHCDEDGKRRMVERLLVEPSPNSFIEVACSRYGSFVVEDLANVNTCKDDMSRCLGSGVDTLSASQFSKKVIDCFGLVVSSAPTVPDGTVAPAAFVSRPVGGA